MTLKELVLEMIANAYENGYEAEIKDLSDEDLAQDIYYYLDTSNNNDSPYTEANVLAAVKEIRNVH